ncbi:hypothetical protein [Dactylosporangium sp. CA-139066]|uniref:hypothetical protein n=1 Tax=Dactylosporangium sp. CA-139066 TaxID=3239930 RepID=UPI003D90016D
MASPTLPNLTLTVPPHDERGTFAVIGGSSYVAYAVHGAPAHLARCATNPDGSRTLHHVGEPFARLDLAVDSGRWRADREAYAATAEHECRHCGTRVIRIGGAWVSVDSTTTAGGLSICPPNPDAAQVGVHQPRRRRS